ncbi:TPA: hypothetical protein ACYHEE_001866 [Escherichia coli]|nr:hypothetical protein [Escherichia coli]
MKKFGDYILPHNAKLAGVAIYGCFYCNSIGDIYYVRIINKVQHFRLLPNAELEFIKRTVELHEI